MTAAVCRSTSHESRNAGLDVLRIAALLLVFCQHVLTSCGLESLVEVHGYRLGRIGTSIFFMLGGYLAGTTRRSPGDWLAERICNLWPSFFLVTAAGFILESSVGHKPFDMWQVLCQFLGIGYFTHGERLINVATWFVSPLIILYLLSSLSRFRSTTVVLTALILLSTVLAFSVRPEESTVYCHGVTWFTAHLVGSFHQNRSRAEMLAVFGVAIHAVLSMAAGEFRYGVLAMITLIVFSRIWRSSGEAGRMLSKISPYTYEWFLVHGICIAAAARVTQKPMLVGILAAVGSALLATALRNVAVRIRHRISESAVKLRSGKATIPAAG